MSLPPLPSKDEWSAWRDNAVTKCFMEVLRRGRDDLMNSWADGEYFGPEIVAENARAVGRCETLKSVREMTFEEMLGVLEDDTQHIGPEAPGSSGFAPLG